MVALLYKKIVSNNSQELRHDIEPIKLTNYKLASNRKFSNTPTMGYNAKKYNVLYRFDVTLLNTNALKIDLQDKIEIDGYKGLVSYIDIAPNQTGRFNKVIYVGLE